MQCQAVDAEQIHPVLNQRIRSPSDYNGDATLQRIRRRNTFKLLKKLKEAQQKRSHQAAFDYIGEKARKSPVEAVCDLLSSGLLELLKQSHLSALGRIDRLFLLR